ncbi:transcription factor bHLH149-like [Dioscorea cayenensis subsp. rotundata]|uniref:Transcription factor bHLH149-like n=1 Tax=Dioscorea cayennensis subsp. rotundata TaxID=55577 RepID=A0AB40BSM5_DIOCR|nr:transcription factor bHLH149-like [Dioscorea cayenensis subsp. rotundata]XP_039129434.1 transcription factor bHLH149-like [Dioscorea cayenensis subsp. rotundata]
MAISNPEAETAKERRRKRGSALEQTQASSSQWRTETEQKIYSSKLLEALRRLRHPESPSPSPSPPKSRAVREAADRALAVAARGRTRWSRAILSSRAILLKARKRRSRDPTRSKRTGSGTGPTGSVHKTPVLQSKAKVLGRLVPGCRKLSFSNLLEEASDYIAALEMQVRAMSALTQILTGVGSGSGSGSGSAAGAILEVHDDH